MVIIMEVMIMKSIIITMIMMAMKIKAIIVMTVMLIADDDGDEGVDDDEQ